MWRTVALALLLGPTVRSLQQRPKSGRTRRRWLKRRAATATTRLRSAHDGDEASSRLAIAHARATPLHAGDAIFPPLVEVHHDSYCASSFEETRSSRDALILPTLFPPLVARHIMTATLRC